jgi:predicted negative regulator of RcsB-dependent stress response
LERAVNLTGSDPTITEHLGDAYSKIGKERDALRQYQDALKKAEDADQIQRLKTKIAAPIANEQHAQH